MAKEPALGEGAAHQAAGDLSQEFDRIVEEKARLRWLADQLGLHSPARGPETEGGPAATSSARSAAAPAIAPAPKAPPPAGGDVPAHPDPTAAPARVSPPRPAPRQESAEAVRGRPAAAPAPAGQGTDPGETSAPPRRDNDATRAGDRPRGGDDDAGPRSSARQDAHRRRPSLPLAPPPQTPASQTPARGAGSPASQAPARGAASGATASASRPPSTQILEALTGFVPAALYEEMKRERDELFFRLTKLEMERSEVERVRRSLDVMEKEVRRLEGEIQRRRSVHAGDLRAEPLRLSYRRWLELRQRRPVRFSDYLACRRGDREEP